MTLTMQDLRDSDFKNKQFFCNVNLYDQFAVVQKFAAAKLASKMRAQCSNVKGPILEIGCGTGLLSKHLLELYPVQQIFLLDISEQMLAQCKFVLADLLKQRTRNIEFILGDAENFFKNSSNNNLRPSYALVASSFAFQWFTFFETTLTCIIDQLAPSGKLCFTVPGSESFPEWQKICRKVDIPFTANPLPAKSQLTTLASKLGCNIELEEFPFVQHFRSSLDFFRNLKKLGATRRIMPIPPLTFDHPMLNVFKVKHNKWEFKNRQFPHLVRSWDREYPQSVKVTYQVLIGTITK